LADAGKPVSFCVARAVCMAGANEGGGWWDDRSIDDLPNIKIKCADTFHNFRGFLRAQTKAVGVIGSGIWL